MAITQHQRLGGLNNTQVFVTILDTGKSKIKALADLASGEDKLFWFFSLCLHREEGARKLLFTRALNPIYEGSTLMI